MGQSDTPAPLSSRSLAELSLGERMVVTAWKAVAAHLAADRADRTIPEDGQQVATGGAGDHDGVMDDALPPALRKRAG